MRALVHTAPFRFEYTRVPAPAVGPEEVLVRVRSVGICGSDVHGFTGQTGRRIPPIIMGHEAAGTVEALGASVRGFEPGEAVCFDSTVYCNQCDACRAGAVNRCAQRQVLGVSIPGMKRQGAMAEFVALPWWTLHRMPEGLDFDAAAMLEPVSIGLHAAARGSVREGEHVLVIGAGTIGLFVLQAARLRGAARIVVSDPSPSRRALARRLGADVTLDPSTDDLEARVREETEGRGADVSFEVVGLAPTLRQAAAATRAGGRVVLVGNLTREVPIDVQEVTSRELTLIGTYASSGEYAEAVRAVAERRIEVEPLISARLPLDEAPRAFERLHAGEEEWVKVVLHP